MFPYLEIVFTTLSTSSRVGGLKDPLLNARLIGSNSRDRDFDRYAVSKLPRVRRRACSEL